MTIASKIRAVAHRIRDMLRGNPWWFLRNVTGVIHVGANSGQERDVYEAYGLDVVWVEPVPEVFAELEANIAPLPKQRAIRGLVTDVDGTDHAFHIANNHGESSSILALKHHKDVWPDVGYDRTVMMQSTTLPSLLARHGIDGRRYQALVLDTQGSELLVLRGAASLLPCFRFVKAEAADFEAYEGCCRIADLTAFLGGHGFRERSRRRFATRRQGGHYYDVIYERGKR